MFFVTIDRKTFDPHVCSSIAQLYSSQMQQMGLNVDCKSNDDLCEFIGQNSWLIVLDNVDHLASFVEQFPDLDICNFLERLFNACPYVRILASSRAPLAPGHRSIKEFTLNLGHFMNIGPDTVRLFVLLTKRDLNDSDYKGVGLHRGQNKLVPDDLLNTQFIVKLGGHPGKIEDAARLMDVSLRSRKSSCDMVWCVVC